MHRPRCLGGYRDSHSGIMILDTCNAGVAGNRTFENCDTGNKPHPYKKYTQLYPQWSIPADISLETSLYWKWLLAHYTTGITEAFKMKKADIPSNWYVQWEDAKEKLEEDYHL